MKKIILSFVILIGALTACTDQFDQYNTDTKHPANVPGESLFSNAQKELTDFISNTNVNINIYKLLSQYWTETTYIDEANYDLVTRNISTGIFSRLYLRVLEDLKQSKSTISSTEAITSSDKVLQKNKLAIIEIMDVYVYEHLVDIFGAVPYSEALDGDNVYPKYESGSAIYDDLFKRLDAALAAIDVDGDGFGSSDLFYGGDVAQWVKFGNALKIKMAITIADADNAKAKALIESAYDKIFESNDDDCQLNYLTDSPNYNQLYADLIASGRHDFVPANTIVSAMSKLEDPRMDAYFADKLDILFPTSDPVHPSVRQTDTLLINDPILLYYNDGTKELKTPDSLLIAGGDGKKVYGVIIPQQDTILAPSYYTGGRYGYSNSYGQCSHIGEVVTEPTYPGILLSYSELCFYLAEAAERGYSVGKNAEEWYNEGIKASFDKWGVSGVAGYLAKPEVAYSTASGSWRQKIGLQSWLANYVRGDVAYNNWRRLDFPILNLPSDLAKENSGLEPSEAYKEIPVRFTFPVNEQTLNSAEYDAAATMIGGDLVTTKVFWDKY